MFSCTGVAGLITSSPLTPLFFFFFNDTATTEIYTLSLHDALPILSAATCNAVIANATARLPSTSSDRGIGAARDRKSTRLNSSHQIISYAVFCLKKKKHTSELQSPDHLVCRLLLVKKKY